MQEKISEHQKSMCSVQEQYEGIKEESRSLQEQVDGLSCQLSQKDREISSLKEELEVHIEKLRQEGDHNKDPRFKEIVRTMERKAEQRENELAVVRKDLDDVRLREEIMKAKCSQMEATLSQHKETGISEVALAQVKSDLNQAFEGKRSELEEAVASQTRLNEEITLLKGTLGESQEVGKEKAVEGNKSLHADMLVLQTKVQSMEEEKSSRSEEFQALQQQNTKYTKQLVNLKDHLIEVVSAHLEMVVLNSYSILCTDSGSAH